jgi:acetyl-CoA carboxylase biotin carboxyl carrier protein
LIDLEFIERLIRVLDESGLDHVEIERRGTRVRVSRSPPVQSIETGNSESASIDDSVAEAPPAEVEAVAELEAELGLSEVTCPMVGTFYRSASPGAELFVEVGSQIAPGDVLGIIEAMKLMNELEAEIRGVIHEVCVGDGEPVEFGQVLFRVRPS